VVDVIRIVTYREPGHEWGVVLFQLESPLEKTPICLPDNEQDMFTDNRADKSSNILTWTNKSQNILFPYFMAYKKANKDYLYGISVSGWRSPEKDLPNFVVNLRYLKWIKSNVQK
jgi:hypothetical protein